MGIFNLDWNGQKYTFNDRVECARFAENMARVESRREAAAGYVTEEMRPSPEVQAELYWREQRDLHTLQKEEA